MAGRRRASDLIHSQTDDTCGSCSCVAVCANHHGVSHNVRASAAKAPANPSLRRRLSTRLRRLQALSLRLADQRVFLRVFDGFNCPIDVEVRPVQVVREEETSGATNEVALLKQDCGSQNLS